MRAVPYGLGLSSSCVLDGWEMVCLVIVDDYYHCAWVFFLVDRGETFGFLWDLILRLKNERNGDVV
jgi:hypothetical protein